VYLGEVIDLVEVLGVKPWVTCEEHLNHRKGFVYFIWHIVEEQHLA
jgi:hypothetical protein